MKVFGMVWECSISRRGWNAYILLENYKKGNTWKTYEQMGGW